jgi:hypothetical protein
VRARAHTITHAHIHTRAHARAHHRLHMRPCSHALAHCSISHYAQRAMLHTSCSVVCCMRHAGQVFDTRDIVDTRDIAKDRTSPGPSRHNLEHATIATMSAVQIAQDFMHFADGRMRSQFLPLCADDVHIRIALHSGAAHGMVTPGEGPWGSDDGTVVGQYQIFGPIRAVAQSLLASLVEAGRVRLSHAAFDLVKHLVSFYAYVPLVASICAGHMAQPWEGSDTYVLDDGKGLPHTIMTLSLRNQSTSGSRCASEYSSGEPPTSSAIGRVLVIQRPVPGCPSPRPLGNAETEEDVQTLQRLLPGESEEVKRAYEEHKEVQRVDEESEEVQQAYEEVQRVHAAKTEQMQLQLEDERCKVVELIQAQHYLESRIRTTEEYIRASDAEKDREILAIRHEVSSHKTALAYHCTPFVRARQCRASCYVKHYIVLFSRAPVATTWRRGCCASQTPGYHRRGAAGPSCRSWTWRSSCAACRCAGVSPAPGCCSVLALGGWGSSMMDTCGS